MSPVMRHLKCFSLHCTPTKNYIWTLIKNDRCVFFGDVIKITPGAPLLFEGQPDNRFFTEKSCCENIIFLEMTRTMMIILIVITNFILKLLTPLYRWLCENFFGTDEIVMAAPDNFLTLHFSHFIKRTRSTKLLVIIFFLVVMGRYPFPVWSCCYKYRHLREEWWRNEWVAQKFFLGQKSLSCDFIGS